MAIRMNPMRRRTWGEPRRLPRPGAGWRVSTHVAPSAHQRRRSPDLRPSALSPAASAAAEDTPGSVEQGR